MALAHRPQGKELASSEKSKNIEQFDSDLQVTYLSDSVC
jgi:hypothetical protein